jgi:hypothetical protein
MGYRYRWSSSAPLQVSVGTTVLVWSSNPHARRTMYSLRDVPLPGFSLGLLSAVSLICTTPIHGLEISQILWAGVGAWFGVDLLCASIVMRDEPPLQTPPHPPEPPE